jgi:TPR repeat protein
MPGGCYQLGLMTRAGDPVARNERLGRYLIRKACVAVEMAACLEVQ